MASTNSFGAHGELTVGESTYEIYRIGAVEGSGPRCAVRCLPIVTLALL